MTVLKPFRKKYTVLSEHRKFINGELSSIMHTAIQIGVTVDTQVAQRIQRQLRRRRL